MNKIEYALLISFLNVLCFSQPAEAQRNSEVIFAIRGGETTSLPDILEDDAFHAKLKELGLHPWHVFAAVAIFFIFEVLVCWVYSAFKKSNMENISGPDQRLVEFHRTDSEGSNSNEEGTEAAQTTLSCRPLFLRNYSTY